MSHWVIERNWSEHAAVAADADRQSRSPVRYDLAGEGAKRSAVGIERRQPGKQVD
jgi:hypothetical protein